MQNVFSSVSLKAILVGMQKTLSIMPKSPTRKVNKFEVDFVSTVLSDFSRMFMSHTENKSNL